MTQPLPCRYAQHHLATTPTGHYIPCCEFKSRLANQQGVELTVTNSTIAEAFESEALQMLRADLDNGIRHPGCQHCWDKEQANLPSKRTSSFIKVQGPNDSSGKLYSLDLKLGNTCNLKCRSCNTYSSSKWLEDEIKLPHRKDQIYKIVDNRYDDDTKFWQDIDFDVFCSVTRIEITGGEPFLVKKHIDLLEKISELGLAKNIHLQYNTNGTVKPADRLTAVWRNFKSVELVFSIDGTFNKFEYLRHPGKWQDFKSIIDSFVKAADSSNFKFGFCYTVTIFNVLDIVRTINYIKTQWPGYPVFLNLAHGPAEFNIQKFPNSIRDAIVRDLRSQLENLNSGHNIEIDHILQYMELAPPYSIDLDQSAYMYYQILAVDDIRQEKFSITFPELNQLLQPVLDRIRDNIDNIQLHSIRNFLKGKLANENTNPN